MVYTIVNMATLFRKLKAMFNYIAIIYDDGLDYLSDIAIIN